MPQGAYLHHRSSLAHDTGAHPENAKRIPAIEVELERRGWPGMERMEAPQVPRETLEAVHPRDYVRFIEEACLRGGGMLDLDTVVSEGSFEAALHSAGGAARMADLLLGERSHRFGFCGLRPPGHHAEATQAMGFCLFNNVAVAARRARDEHGAERVLVLDWDVHHGNGTNDVFHSDAGVMYVSIHQWPLYPGTGPAGDVGEGAGEGCTVNLPVPPGSGDEVFVSHVEHLVAPLARAYAPALVLVSAGYDAHRDDPLASCEVSDEGYAAMAGAVRGVADDLEVPVGVVLEGGYELGALARSVAATVEALAAESPPQAGGTSVHPLTAEAAARLARFWPVLSAAG